MKKSFTLTNEILNQYQTPEGAGIDMLDGIELLQESTNGPSDRVLRNIFGYASALSVIKTKLTGNINLVLN